MHHDLKAAAKVQHTFLPSPTLRVAGVDFAWCYQPCDELGGDGLNIIPLGEGRVGLYVLDVSGHGVSSALLSVALSRLLSPPSDPSSILMGDGEALDRSKVVPPAQVADRLNQLFPFDMATRQYATLIYGALNIATGDFHHVCAGHKGPLFLPAGGPPAILDNPGSPIGLAEDAYAAQCVHLEAGDRLYLYSDGIPDAMSPAREPFGEDRLREAVGRSRAAPLQEAVATLLKEVTRWQGTNRTEDDFSILAVELAPAAHDSRCAGLACPAGGASRRVGVVDRGAACR